MTRKHYTAIAERSDGWWAVTIEALPGVFTQARRLDQVADLAADAIGLWLEKDPKTIAVTVETRLPEDLQRAVDIARAAREAAERASIHAATSTTSAVASLSTSGLSMRDTGIIIGVSYQRVGQLVEGSAGTKRKLPAKRTKVKA